MRRQSLHLSVVGLVLLTACGVRLARRDARQIRALTLRDGLLDCGAPPAITLRRRTSKLRTYDVVACTEAVVFHCLVFSGNTKSHCVTEQELSLIHLPTF